MRVLLHGINPYKICPWQEILTMSGIDAYSTLMRAHLKVPEKKRKPLGANRSQFDDRFLPSGYRILFSNKHHVVALYNDWPRWKLIYADKDTFVTNFKAQRTYHPNQVVPYAEE